MLRRIVRLVARNPGLKLLSLFLAVLLWYLAAGQEQLEASYIVPLEFTNVPETVALEGNSLEFVHVRLRGSRSAIQGLSPQQIAASVDLGGVKPGDHILTLDDRNIKVPGDVQLVSVTPQYLTAKVSARRLVPIRVTLRGRPADGYEVVRASALPGKIYVIGPPHKVSVIREVGTLPVSIRGATAPVTARAEMVPPDPEVRLMEIQPTEVNVVIQGHQETRVFRGVPVSPPDPSAALTPPLVQVTLRGPFDLLEKLVEGEVRARVEPPPPGGRSYVSKVTATAPEGFTVVGVVPSAVRVTLP